MLMFRSIPNQKWLPTFRFDDLWYHPRLPLFSVSDRFSTQQHGSSRVLVLVRYVASIQMSGMNATVGNHAEAAHCCREAATVDFKLSTDLAWTASLSRKSSQPTIMYAPIAAWISVEIL